MKSLRQKRQQMIKQARTRQRNQKFAQNREKFFETNEEQSLVSLIFLMIDKDSEDISSECFEDFLEIISEEMRGYSEGEKKINEQIKTAILERYTQKLREFVQNINKQSVGEIIQLIKKDSKSFDLIRFLFRLQVIKKIHLQTLDSLLSSVDARIKDLSQKQLTQNVDIGKRIEGQLIAEEFMNVLQIRHKLYKQLAHLQLVVIEINQQKQCLEVENKQKQLILLLIEKWIEKQLPFNFLFSPRLINLIQKQKMKPQFKKLLNYFGKLYLQFVIGNQNMQQKLLDQSEFIKHPQKVLEFILVLFLSLQQDKCSKEIEITNDRVNNLSQQLLLYLDLTLIFIKRIQQKMAKTANGNSTFYFELLNALVNCYVEQPREVLGKFIEIVRIQVEKNGLIDIKRKEGVTDSWNVFLSLSTKSSQILIIKLLHSIQDMEYGSLVSFVELLPIVVSYSDKSIHLLFQIPNFEGYYDQKLNFENILERKLMSHISIEIRRRAFWLLSNIAGSEQFYQYGLHFIKGFYTSDVLEQDYASTKLSKEELLIKESILQTIMNYLSNIKTYQQIQDFLSFTRPKSKDKAQYNSTKPEESMFVWIIKVLASVIKNFSQNSVVLNESQKFIQVLIYSLYNILTLENGHQSTENSESVVLSIIENYEIPKCLQIIYQNAETTNQYSNFYTMMQTLLDQIQKVKNFS